MGKKVEITGFTPLNLLYIVLTVVILIGNAQTRKVTRDSINKAYKTGWINGSIITAQWINHNDSVSVQTIYNMYERDSVIRIELNNR